MQSAVRLAGVKVAKEGQITDPGRSRSELLDLVGTSGQPTNSTCVRLVAAGVNADIYIWVQNRKGEWSLFGREPGADRKSKEIWLKLEDQHYEWLKPRTLQGTQKEEHATLIEEWRTRAFCYPTAGLQGKGQDEDIRSILGLSVTPSSKLAAEARSPSGPSSKLDDEVKSMLGIGNNDDVRKELFQDDDKPYVPGEIYRCVCGWQPYHEKSHQGDRRVGHLNFAAAVKHWRECQGTELPKQRSNAKTLSRMSTWIRNNPQVRALKKRRCFLREAAWRSSSPQRIQQGVCELDENLHETVVRGGRNVNAYRCKKCGALRAQGSTNRYCCPNRPAELKRAEVLKVTLGRRAAQKYFGYEKTTKTGIDKQAQLRQRRKENGKAMSYWEQYTKRPDVIAARKRRNEAFYAKHKVAYNARRAEQKRAQRRAAGIAPRPSRQKLGVKKKPACHQH